MYTLCSVHDLVVIHIQDRGDWLMSGGQNRSGRSERIVILGKFAGAGSFDPSEYVEDRGDTTYEDHVR